MTLTQKIGGLIDAFQPASGPPPQTLIAFVRWALRGAWPMLWIAGLVSAIGGIFEVLGPYILGRIIDGALSTGPESYFTGENVTLLVLSLVFFLAVRPVFMGLNAMTNAMVVQPNVQPLVLQRLHRWTLGQSLTYFQDDFAGRLAQKQLQAARAITDVAAETIQALFFSLASVFGALAMVAAINPSLALILILWMASYILLLRHFMPKIRKLSKARANSRAAVTGQIVDTVTNITTVKLFAHSDREDRAALAEMADFRQKALGFGKVSAMFPVLADDDCRSSAGLANRRGAAVLGAGQRNGR